jgi:hypothetical protein
MPLLRSPFSSFARNAEATPGLGRLSRRGRAGACEDVGGGSAGELAELPDEVRLVGVAAIGGDTVPLGRLAVSEPAPDVLEAQQPGRCLGSEADLLPKFPDQMLVAPPSAACQRPNRHGTGATDQPPPGPSHFGRRGGSAANAVQQEIIERGEPLAPGLQLADPIAQPPSVAADQVPRSTKVLPSSSMCVPSSAYRPSGDSHASRYDGAHAPSITESEPCGPLVNSGGRSAEFCTFTTMSTEVVAGRTKPPDGSVPSVNPA